MHAWIALAAILIAEVPGSVPEGVVARTRRPTELTTHFGKDAEVIAKLSRGAEVRLLMENSRSLQVRTKRGAVGWLNIDDLAVERIVPRVERTLWTKVKGWDAKGPIRKVSPDETLEVLGYAEEDKWFRVRTEQGEEGYLHIQSASPSFATDLPGYDHRAVQYWRADRLRAAVIGKSAAEVEAALGTPLASWAQDGEGFVFYRRLHYVEDVEVFSEVRIPIREGKAADLEPRDGPESSWVESLPLAHTIRGLELGHALQAWEGLAFLPDASGHGWFGWLWRAALKLVALVLFLSIPHFLASGLTTAIGYVRRLDNLVVALAGFTMTVAFTYLFFLTLSLHVLHEEQWFIALALLLLLSFSCRIIFYRVFYKRCPACHAMFSATDEGSTVLGKKHRTIHKSQDVYRGKTETSTTITHNYERQKWKERETDIQIEDHMQCSECGFRWDIEREKTVQGHV